MVGSKRAYNWYISLVAAGCMVLIGYDASVFNSVQTSDHWLTWMNRPSNQMLGLINTTYSIGGIIAGWFVAGPLSDYYGRKWGMGVGCFLTVIATFIQTWTPYHKVGVFITGRCIVSFGQGLAMTAGPTYISEVTPSYIRGKVMTFWQLFYSVGSFVAYWINYATSKHRKTLGNWDWKIVVIFQMLLPLIILSQLPFMPESPRWYIQKGNRVEEARKSLQRTRDSEQEVEDELLVIREALEFEKEALDSGKKAYLALWKDKSIRKRLILAMIINVGQQLTGQGTLNSYSSTIYKKVWTNLDTINLINALNATFGILFTLNAMWTVDRFGRKFLLIGGAIGMAICMFLVAIVGLETPNINGAKSTSVGIAIVFLMFLFIAFYKPSWGATVWIFTSEIFPMNVRAQAVGMCVQMQGVANCIFQQFFPTFYANCGLKSFFFFMSANICLAAFAWWFLPETKKVPLEEIDVLFGGANHVEKGAALIHGDGSIADAEKSGTVHELKEVTHQTEDVNKAK